MAVKVAWDVTGMMGIGLGESFPFVASFLFRLFSQIIICTWMIIWNSYIQWLDVVSIQVWNLLMVGLVYNQLHQFLSSPVTISLWFSSFHDLQERIVRGGGWSRGIDRYLRSEDLFDRSNPVLPNYMPPIDSGIGCTDFLQSLHGYSAHPSRCMGWLCTSEVWWGWKPGTIQGRKKGCDILRLAYLVDVFLGSAKSSVHEIVGTFFAL